MNSSFSTNRSRENSKLRYNLNRQSSVMRNNSNFIHSPRNELNDSTNFRMIGANSNLDFTSGNQ